ncbi:MAG: ABC transporter ATP-binding protein [Synergistaceae bacterium]|nr:ABC transporter ATP-binding protein [Synergistaceae bacterium]
MENPGYILEMRNIRKTFGALAANDDITLKVRKGSVHSLIGENGAGKSTLMNILTGIYRPDYGEIFLGGRKVNFRNPQDAARHGIGMVYQEFMLFRELSVLENIMYGFEEKKAFGILIDRKKSKKKLEEICEKYHFNIPLGAKVADLPVSMLQQVEIVKVLYKGADIIVLDEPTSVLTPQGVEGLFDAVRFLVASGKTIIFITHKLKEVFAVADEITVLRDGKVTGNVRCDGTTENALANLMVGRDVTFGSGKSVHEPGVKVLEVRNLSVRDKDGVLRLKEASFDVREGEIVGIAGVAGSGQQQLVEAVFGISRAEKGRVTFLGNDVTDAEPRDRRLMGMGYVPQDRLGAGGNAAAAIWENSIMGYHISENFKSKFFLSRQEVENFADKVVSQFNVKTRSIDDKLSSLSGGNIQKLIVGRESIQDKKLLIVEDPTRGIDVGAIEFVWGKMLDIVKSGMSILLVSHEINEVMQLSDRILVIYEGRLYDGGAYLELDDKEIGFLMTGGGAA